MTVTITHKRGDTFSRPCVRKNGAGTVIDITSTTIAAKIRRAGFVATLTVTKTDAANGAFTIAAAAAATATWAPGLHQMDIEYTDGAVVQSTDTINVNIIADVTYAD